MSHESHELGNPRVAFTPNGHMIFTLDDGRSSAPPSEWISMCGAQDLAGGRPVTLEDLLAGAFPQVTSASPPGGVSTFRLPPESLPPGQTFFAHGAVNGKLLCTQEASPQGPKRMAPAVAPATHVLERHKSAVGQSCEICAQTAAYRCPFVGCRLFICQSCYNVCLTVVAPRPCGSGGKGCRRWDEGRGGGGRGWAPGYHIEFLPQPRLCTGILIRFFY